MKMNFAKILKVSVVFILFLSVNLINAQTISYKILKNDPENVQNFGASITPASLSFSSAIVNYNVGADAFYRFKDRLMLSSGFAFGLINDVDAKFNNFFGSSELKYDISPHYNFNVDAHFFPIKFKETLITNVNLNGINTGRYTRIPLEHQVLIGLRLGYNSSRHAYTLDAGDVRFYGFSTENPNERIKLNGTFNYRFNALKVGLGVYIKSKSAVKVKNPGISFSSTKRDQGVKYFYVDYLYPLNQSFSSIYRVFPSSNTGADGKTVEYQIDSDPPMSHHGFVGGMSWFSMTKNNRLFSGKMEIGMLPGPIEKLNNFYISVGIGFGIGKHLK